MNDYKGLKLSELREIAKTMPGYADDPDRNKDERYRQWQNQRDALVHAAAEQVAEIAFD